MFSNLIPVEAAEKQAVLRRHITSDKRTTSIIRANLDLSEDAGPQMFRGVRRIDAISTRATSSVDASTILNLRTHVSSRQRRAERQRLSGAGIPLFVSKPFDPLLASAKVRKPFHRPLIRVECSQHSLEFPFLSSYHT